jgi:hypothetical protein
MRQLAGQTAKYLAVPSSHRHALAIFECRNRTMSTLLPVGITTRHSLFAVWVARDVPLADADFSTHPRFADRSVASDGAVGAARLPGSHMADRVLHWQTGNIERCTFASPTAGTQVLA